MSHDTNRRGLLALLVGATGYAVLSNNDGSVAFPATSGDSSGDELLVPSGETYTIAADTSETYSTTTIESGGTLTQEPGSTLNTTG